MDMKKVGRKMSMLMGTTMSFCMSLIGNLTSGHFTVPGFIISLLVSIAITLIIGFIVPIGPLSQGASRKCGLERGSMKARCLESLIADLCFTPVMTLAMITFAYNMSKKHGEAMKFVPAFLSSLGIGLVVCFMLAFILTPVYLKLAMKGAAHGGPPPEAGKKDED